ncbi:MAG: TRAP transporter large permease [Deltaproteobacteria bacterium]|nr:TRAP transporter large permease [Deltaproteobacteria bacterium]
MVVAGIIFDFLLFAIGLPIFIAFGLGSAIVLLFFYGVSVTEIASIMFSAVDNYTLLAAPLFILLGSIVVSGGMGNRLIDFTLSLFGHFPGGLIVASIAFCTIFAALSGSGLAAIAAIGTIMFPELRKQGYSVEVSSGAIASGGQLGILIPPSIFFIVIAMLMQISAADLFAGGLFPGLLMAVGLCVVGVLGSRRQKIKKLAPAGWRERGRAFLKAFPSLIMILLVLGGIYSGIFTPTEAATIACVYAGFVSFVIHKELTWKKLFEALGSASFVTSAIYLLIGGIFIFNMVLSRAGISIAVADFVMASNFSPLTFIILLNIFVVVVSFVIDPWALMFMIIPVLMPTFLALEVNLIWLGVMMCIGTMIGYLTPPMAPGLYFTSRVLNVPAMQIARGLIPYLIVMAIVIPVCIIWPGIITWLPNQLP